LPSNKPTKRRAIAIARAMFKGLVDSLQPLRRHSRGSAPWQLYGLWIGKDQEAQGINLLDYGCIRIFTPKFVGGVVDLYEGLLHKDFARTVHAYETWGFRGLTKDLAETLNIWARFIYALCSTTGCGASPMAWRRRTMAARKPLLSIRP